SPIDAGVTEAVAAGLREHAEPVGPASDRDRVEEPAGAGVDDVHDVVIASRHPELAAVGGHAAHVGAAADLPGRPHLVRGEVDHGDAAVGAVGDVEGTAVAARVQAVRALAGRGERPLLHPPRIHDRYADAI